MWPLSRPEVRVRDRGDIRAGRRSLIAQHLCCLSHLPAIVGPSHLMANRLNGLSTTTASRNTPRLKSLSESVIRAMLVQNRSLLPPTVKYTTCTPPVDRVETTTN